MSEKYWRDDEKIYGDGSFEVLWGFWKQDTEKVLGIHWIKSDESDSCPKLYGGSLGWLVVPKFLTLSVLNSLLVEIRQNPGYGSEDLILEAIQEFAAQQKTHALSD